MPPSEPEPQPIPVPSPRWKLMTILGIAAFAFLGWWVLLLLAHGLGTCGEDSSFTDDEYRRMCGGPGEGGGLVAHRLIAIGLVAAATTLAVGAAVWLRRAHGRAVVGAIGALIVLGGLGVFVGG